MKKAIVLLSGGLDSATCAIIAKSKGYEIYAMSFSYGQKHDIEIENAKKVAEFIGVIEHKIINIDTGLFRNSSLVKNANIQNTKNDNNKNNANAENSTIQNTKGQALGTATVALGTYVPARNTLFLSYALALAEGVGASDIFIGVTAVDYSGYPDCRPDYIEAYQKMADLATQAGRDGKPIAIRTPLINLRKAEIISLGADLGMDYSLTHSCYFPNKNGLACSKCDSCLHRKKGFEQAKILDPTRYV